MSEPFDLFTEPIDFMHDPPRRIQSPPAGIRVVCRSPPSDAAAQTSTEPSSDSGSDSGSGVGGGAGGWHATTANAVIYFVDYGDEEGFPAALSTGPAYDGVSSVVCVWWVVCGWWW